MIALARLFAFVVAACVVLVAGEAHAAVVRYAVVIGNDRGDADETELLWAETDARKVFDVLHDLGRFEPANMVLLLDEDPDTVERALVDVNDRIRTATGRGDDVVLFVYYSGHADADALHLGGKHLDTAHLERLVRGSSAQMRVLVLDACRSGALTRVKGGSRAGPMAVTFDERLTEHGVVFLTSSAANEDAQESDALKGSFFTHYFVSGLVGAADTDHDARVTLDEAYAYAYENTLRASSQSLHGTQHPTYRFDLKGRGGVVLTEVGLGSRRRSLVEFAGGRSWLLIADDRDGPIVAEVGLRDSARTLNVEPGRYFVRGRAADHLLEGTIRVDASETRTVDDSGLRRIEYARLARKGGSDRRIAHGPQAGYQMRTPLWSGAALCHGARIGYAVEHRFVSVVPRVGFCRSSFSNASLDATADELDLDVTLTHVFDVPVVSIGLGLVGGVTWLRQDFDSTRVAPPRNTIGGHADAVLTLTWDLPRGFYIQTDIAGQVHLFREQSGPRQSPRIAAVVTARPFAAVGKRF